MGYVHIIFTFLAIYSAFVAPALATEFVVGDEHGWTLHFDYQSWAMGKEFHVGDKLIFRYEEGSHNVYKVDGTGFKQCSTSAALGAALTSGNDVITLATPGRKWYICGIGSHCANGKMKLVINVLPPVAAWSPTPPPMAAWSPTPPPVAAWSPAPTPAPYYSPGSSYGSPWSYP